MPRPRAVVTVQAVTASGAMRAGGEPAVDEAGEEAEDGAEEGADDTRKPLWTGPKASCGL